MNTGWRTLIRSGTPEIDLQMLERHRLSAEQQGFVLHKRSLPDGGFEVATAPPGAPSPFDTAPAFAPIPAPQPAPSWAYGNQTFQAPVVARPNPGGGSCGACGRAAQTKNLTFMQNIGVLVIRFPKRISGPLCRHCVDKHFFEMTGITMLFGWWGVISFMYSLVAIPVNVVNYLRALGLEAPPDDVRSLGDKKIRAIYMVVLGVLLLIPAALLGLGSLAIVLDGDDDSSSGVVGLVCAIVLFAIPAFLLFVFGIVKRVRASRQQAALLFGA